MANVIATARGYFGSAIREPGDIFAVPDDLSAPWFKPVDGDAPAPASDPDAGEQPKSRAGRKAKVETVTAPTATPFADAPEPVRVENAINAITGGTQPDWIAQGADI